MTFWHRKTEIIFFFENTPIIFSFIILQCSLKIILSLNLTKCYPNHCRCSEYCPAVCLDTSVLRVSACGCLCVSEEVWHVSSRWIRSGSGAIPHLAAKPPSHPGRLPVPTLHSALPALNTHTHTARDQLGNQITLSLPETIFMSCLEI